MVSTLPAGSTNSGAEPPLPVMPDATISQPPVINPTSNGTHESSGASNHPEKSPTRHCNTCGWICLIVCFVIAGIFIGIAVTNSRKNEDVDRSRTEATAPPKTSVYDRCPVRKIRITEICDLPDLDDDFFGSDHTMDIKLLVNDDQYWPQNVLQDCLPDYGSYYDTCVIPDSTLMIGCFALPNPIDLVMSEDDDAPPLKVTIYDKDIITDDFLDIIIPKEDWWYFPDDSESCHLREQSLEFQTGNSRSSARIKMTVVAGETVDSLSPNLCGITSEDPAQELGKGLLATSQEFQKLQTVLNEYVTLNNVRHLRRRNLFFGALIAGGRALVSGVRAFGGLFARGARANSGRLSALADFASIGSALLSLNGPGDESAAEQKALFDKVFERFDEIDRQLDGIERQLQDGFEQIELVIQEEFAQQELDEWINVHLSILADDYRAFRDASHTAETRPAYEDIFRDRCRSSYSPYTIFKVLYSHACETCQLLGVGQPSRQYILDTFVDLAQSNLEDVAVTDRVLWFRKSFGTVMVAALTEAMYLHSVCLYQPEAVCQNEDPVWANRLEEMGDALDEIAASLTDAELRLE